MGFLTLLCVITVAFTGLTSGAGVLPDDSVTALAGDSVTFNTSVTPVPTALDSIAWEVGTKNILFSVNGGTSYAPEYKNRVTLSTSDGSLELRNVAVTDTGVYGVNIRREEGDETVSGSTTLTVYERVSNVKVTASSLDLVEFNDTLTLICSASGSPESFLWFKDSTELTASDRISFSDRNSTVTIDPVLREDQGSYSCEAFNPVSSSTSGPVSLSVSYGPEGVTLRPPPLDEYWEDSVVPFSCSAVSKPEAQFKWLLEGELLSYTGAQIDLVIKKSGNYSCQAFNSKTLRYTTSEPAALTMWEKIKDPSVESSNHPVEGASVNLTCDAIGSFPIREWMFNGAEIQPSGNIQFYDEKRVLSFRSLTRIDNGVYTCKISNNVSSQNADYTMKVNYGPENVAITGPTDIKERETLTLSCSSDSEPAAKYDWIKSGITVGQSSEYTKQKISLSDGGEYICRATNDITTKSFEASHGVNVTALPPLPRCSPGCIAGIVIGVIAVILIVAGVTFYMLKKKKQTPKSTSRTDGEGQDNSTYAQNQEVQYADVRFVKKGGQNNPEYAQVRKNNRPPASSLPSYEAHEQRHGRPAPEPSTLYADVRVK